MQWNRVRTILIIIFVLVNAYLLSHYISVSQHGSNVSPEVIGDTISILSQQSIQINREIIPSVTHEVRVFDVTNKYGSKESIAMGMLGEGYFVSDLQVYTKDSKKLTIDGSEITLLVNHTQTDAIIPELIGLDESACRKYADKILGEYALDNTYKKIVTTDLANGECSITYNMVFDEKTVVDSRLKLIITEYGVKKIWANNWLSDTISEGTFVPTRSAAAMLVNFANNSKIEKPEGMEITSIDECYYFGKRIGESKTTTVIPVWRVTTKQDGIFLYDARNNTFIE